MKYSLSEGVGGAPDGGDRGADLDGAGPAQLLQKIDLHPRQHRSRAGNLKPVLRIVNGPDPAGFQEGGKYRVVAVPLTVEIGEANDVGYADGEICDLR